MTKPCVAASSYLNTAPLCYSFTSGQQRSRCEFLSDAAPARCAELLEQRTADAALIPVIEYQRIPGLKVVPGVCVASRDIVKSVVLASRVPIDKVTSVALDTSSRTSAALIRIILREFYDLQPRFTPISPSIEVMLENNDAALLIGDPAMLIDRGPLLVYDLAAEWKSHTGLPFVFAFWAVRADSKRSATPGHCVDFVAAKREGLAHVEEIAQDYSGRLGLSQAELLSYLTRNISYDLDESTMQGLNLYFRLAYETGLIPRRVELDYF